MELDRVKMMMKENSSGWSEVSGGGDLSPQPPPPPPDRDGMGSKFTPNGTQVPDGPPPSVELPPWPFPVDVDEYETVEDGGRWIPDLKAFCSM